MVSVVLAIVKTEMKRGHDVRELIVLNDVLVPR